jgi:hypothetical protein
MGSRGRLTLQDGGGGAPPTPSSNSASVIPQINTTLVSTTGTTANQQTQNAIPVSTTGTTVNQQTQNAIPVSTTGTTVNQQTQNTIPVPNANRRRTIAQAGAPYSLPPFLQNAPFRNTALNPRHMHYEASTEGPSSLALPDQATDMLIAAIRAEGLIQRHAIDQVNRNPQFSQNPKIQQAISRYAQPAPTTQGPPTTYNPYSTWRP